MTDILLNSTLGRLLLNYWGIILLIAAWQTWVYCADLNAIVMPSPIDVVIDIFSNLGLYLKNGTLTLVLAVVGLIAGMFVGTAIAAIAWTSRITSGLLVPLGLILSSIPIVALIPILARLLGYDIQTVLAIVVIISFFPAFVFTSAGLNALPPGSSDLFKVFGANPVQRFVFLVLPSAVPSWMIALRLTAPPAVLVAMLAEFLMATPGMGGMFRDSLDDFAMDRAIGTSLIATAVSTAAFLLATYAEGRVKDRWS
mgnify:FL=1